MISTITNRLNRLRNYIASLYARIYCFIVDALDRAAQIVQNNVAHIILEVNYRIHNAWDWARNTRLATSLANRIPSRMQNAPQFVVEQSSRPVSWLWERAQQMSAPFRQTPVMSPIPESAPTVAIQRPGA